MCGSIKDKVSRIPEVIYQERTRIILLISVILHIVDIVTDIIVTSDLYNENSSYFAISLGILVFSFLGSALLSLNDDKFISFVKWERRTMAEEPKCNKIVIRNSFSYSFKMVLWMFLDITQINYFIDCCIVLSIWKKRHGNIYHINRLKKTKDRMIIKKLKESLLESGPESLFQLFIILKRSSNQTFMNLLTYYISVMFSLLNLTYTLVSTDHYYLDKFLYDNYYITEIAKIEKDSLVPASRRKRDGFITAPAKLVHKIQQEGLYKASYLSKYSLNIILFRLTEVFSRIGLLACISQIYDGYYLFLFILMDFICLNVLNGLKRFIRYKVEKCEFSIYTLDILKRSEYATKWKLFLDYQSRKDSFDFTIGLFNNIPYITSYVWDAPIYNVKHLLFKTHRNYSLSLKEIKDLPIHLDWKKIYSAYKILLCWRIYKKDKIRNIFKLNSFIQATIARRNNEYISAKEYQNGVLVDQKKAIYDSKYCLEIYGLRHILESIKYLGVYYKPLSWPLIRDDKYYAERNYFKSIDFPVNLPDSNRWWNKISMHFISKYINHLIISIVLIYNLLIETHSVTIVNISTTSMACYIINMASLYFVIKWNNAEEEERSKIMLNPVINIKCKTIHCCFCCCTRKKKESSEEECKTIEDG